MKVLPTASNSNSQKKIIKKKTKTVGQSKSAPELPELPELSELSELPESTVVRIKPKSRECDLSQNDGLHRQSDDQETQNSSQHITSPDLENLDQLSTGNVKPQNSSPITHKSTVNKLPFRPQLYHQYLGIDLDGINEVQTHHDQIQHKINVNKRKSIFEQSPIPKPMFLAQFKTGKEQLLSLAKNSKKLVSSRNKSASPPRAKQENSQSVSYSTKNPIQKTQLSQCNPKMISAKSVHGTHVNQIGIEKSEPKPEKVVKEKVIKEKVINEKVVPKHTEQTKIDLSLESRTPNSTVEDVKNSNPNFVKKMAPRREKYKPSTSRVEPKEAYTFSHYSNSDSLFSTKTHTNRSQEESFEPDALHLITNQSLPSIEHEKHAKKPSSTPKSGTKIDRTKDLSRMLQLVNKR